MDYVTIERAPGEEDTGKVQCVVKIPPRDPGIPPPTKKMLEEMLPGRYAIVRDIEFSLADEEDRCIGPLLFHVCKYRKFKRIIFYGFELKPGEPLTGFKETTEVIGVCPLELIKLLASLGLSAIPSLFGALQTLFGEGRIADTRQLGARVETQELASALAGFSPSPEPSAPIVKPQISRQVFIEIVELAASIAATPTEIEPPQVLEGGRADLTEIAAALPEAEVPALRALFDRLAAARIPAVEQLSGDEAWILEAATVLRHENGPGNEASVPRAEKGGRR